jgi:hypothetical protein
MAVPELSSPRMIAACAHEAGAGVLHYDRDYDLIAEHTSLSFESVWLAQPEPCDCSLTAWCDVDLLRLLVGSDGSWK